MGTTQGNLKIEPRTDAGLTVEPEIDYHTHWKAFAVRRSLALFLLFGWLPFCGSLCLVPGLFAGQPGWCLLAMGLWLAAAFAAVWYAGEFRCPRCRRRYGSLGHRKGDANLTRGIFDKVCSNCKLRKFEHG